MAEHVQITPERLAELRRIAEAATPGPWTWDEESGEEHSWELTICCGDLEVTGGSVFSTWAEDVIDVPAGATREEAPAASRAGKINRAADRDVAATARRNAEYIAALDPATVLALLDEIERLRRVVERVQHVWMWFHPDQRPFEDEGMFRRRYYKFYELGEVLDAALSSAPENPYAAVVEAAIRWREERRRQEETGDSIPSGRMIDAEDDLAEAVDALLDGEKGGASA